MSRSSFFSRSSRDSSPLIAQHTHPLSLHDIPTRNIQNRTASPSPPPSFYHDTNHHSVSPSPSRTKARRIQFAAPPPPIATSGLLSSQHASSASMRESFRGLESGRSSSPRLRRGSGAIEPLLALERRQRSIQQDIQALLDAQSLGLVQGFGGAEDGSSDAGSSTPTSRSVHGSTRGQNGGAVPVRQPKKKAVGLRGARRGLLRDMQELVSVKREEEGLLSVEIVRRDDVLSKVDVWEKRIESVRGQLDGHGGAGGTGTAENEEGGEDAREIAELMTEEAAVDNEIQELEDRLAQMRARKRWLGERINEGINRQEARLSSYRGALREVESEVKEFLRRPPIPVSVVMGDEESFTALPASRRTLAMAQEWWSKEISQLKSRQQEVRAEHAALEEGAELWQEIMKIVVEFEDGLRREMTSNAVQGPGILQKQIEKMEKVIQTLSGTLQLVEDRGWNLLICAVGAELEAFREGEGIMRGVLGAAQDSNDSLHGDERSETRSTNGLEELNGRSETSKSLDHEDSEDDGPNLAELLVDRGDADGIS